MTVLARLRILAMGILAASGSMIGEEYEDWRKWIAEAHSLISAWEAAEPSRRLLSVREAAELAETIARGLDDAFERGRRWPSDAHT